MIDITLEKALSLNLAQDGCVASAQLWANLVCGKYNTTLQTK
jgi:hypothetical protein